MSPNLALISIPAYYLLSLAPHMYALNVRTQGQPSQLDNANPRSTSNQEEISSRLSSEELARYERAEAAHKNNFENLPLYIGAVFAGLLAEQATKGTIGKTYVSSGVSTGLTRFVYGWFALRGLYNVAYIATTDQKVSYLRSGLYFATVGLAFEQFWNAAQILGY